MNFQLDLLAKIVCNSFNVSVANGPGFAIGKTPSGNLVIYIPRMTVGNEDDAAIVRSGLAHEAVGHGRHTDFNAKRGPTPLHLAIENVLEDARIEKAAWKIYPKTRKILDEGMAVMTKRKLIKRASNQSSPAEKAAVALLLRLMVEELGYCKSLIDWKADWAEAVQCFGDETMNKAWAEALVGYQQPNTAEVIKVAARIVKLFQQGYEQQQQPQQGKGQGGGDDAQSGGSNSGKTGDQGDGDGDQGGNSSSGDGDEDGKGKSKSKSKGKSKDDGKDGKDGKDGSGAGDGQDDGQDDGQGDQDGQDGHSDSNGVGDQANSTATASGSSHAQHAPTPLDLKSIRPEEFDRGDLLKVQIQNKAVNTSKIPSGKRSPSAFVPPDAGKAAAQRLKSSLAQRLLAVVEDEDDSLVEFGTLASHRLVDAVMGDRYVFSEPGKPGERLDTAFSLLIDMSGSMSGVPGDSCLAATWAIGDTLNGYAGMGVAFTISSFDGSLYVLKDWKEPWKRGEVLAGYRPHGSTATYGAVEDRLAHLVKRTEARKVLYLITDGDIGNLEPLVNTAKEMGVEFVVMMIGDKDCAPKAPYLKRFSVIRPNEIATTMLKTVTSLF